MTIRAEIDDAWAAKPVAVLAAGFDSAVLVALLARRCPSVTPLYVRCGLVWEEAEEQSLRNYLAQLAHDPRYAAVQPLEVFHNSAREAYGDHWSITGERVPNEASTDAEVFLPGRNLMLLTPTSLWAYRHGIETIALGSLRGNPFADAQRTFFDRWEIIFEQSVGRPLRIVQPLAHLTKRHVLELGRDLPLELTLSCLAPIDGRPCGHCNKCAERAAATR